MPFQPSAAELKLIEELKSQGLGELLALPGLGAKKVQTLWKEAGVTSLEELETACQDSSLDKVKGFGTKTKEKLLSAIALHKTYRGKRLISEAQDIAQEVVQHLESIDVVESVAVSGEVLAHCEVVSNIDIVAALSDSDLEDEIEENLELPESVDVHFVETIEFEEAVKDLHCEQEGCHIQQSGLVDDSDIKGVIHAHTKYSDGAASLKDMALAVKNLGYEYFGVSDHSKSAAYAGGLFPDKIKRQHDEIDQLNEELAPFKILKGIESDILKDGSLDYDENTLETFDFIIASIHSGFSTPKEEQTQRIVRAIENPHTSILGHMTGRLLLKREGYEIDIDEILEACAKHNVAIELNANPRRLDIDWRIIPKARALGIKIPINPDAHSIEGIEDIKYGVGTARKGGLNKEEVLNTFTLSEIEEHFKKP